MKRISLIVGHTEKSPGATNYKEESEYSFNSRVANKIAKHIQNITDQAHTKVFYRDGIGRSGVAKLVTEWRADISLELHFNSFRKVAYGCEILVLDENLIKNSLSFDVADDITDRLAEKFMLKERGTDGVNPIDDGDRGYYNLKLLQSIPINMLIEPCFANIKTAESSAIFEDEDKYAAIVGNGIVHALEIVSIPSPPESKPHSSEELQELTDTQNIPRAYPKHPDNEKEECYLEEIGRLRKLIRDPGEIERQELLVSELSESVKSLEDQLANEKIKVNDLSILLDKQTDIWDKFMDRLHQEINVASLSSEKAWEK